MENKTKILKAIFFRTANGAEPVREQILDLLPDERKIVGTDIMAVEFGWPVGLPVCRPMSGGLFEVRSNINKRIFRVLFSIDSPDMILLHAFIKKTQKTPPQDLKLAKDRWKMYQEMKKGY
ncbi:type II toxin-antitoxin system RelE/ParE family toxin [Kiloniella laminariae]|uniref:Type II toxin-antitoxin system RelE/ParE family toxin n=1 Tax=Kiloniella laminariae TaxID=454162 RepID=A0ABT4LPT4_9PROT|nr:type II toxin-antitoxin system RelE/ParE family toxin [Kiloniella laminariae]MCZ4283144.1 type II toxin-antitoxin system RelE/ParE family toxin [Kiloniella laminariae]